MTPHQAATNPWSTGDPRLYDTSDDDDDKKEEPTDIASLREKLAALQLCLNNMDERVAKTEIDRMELGDKVDTLHKAICSKIKHLAKATGNEDLYRSPDPK